MKLALSLLMVALLAGCATAPQPAATPATSPKETLPPEIPAPGDHSLAFLKPDGTKREYLLHAPPDYASGKRYPLVIALHGSGGTPQEMAKMTKLSELADTKGFVVVYPRSFQDADTIAQFLDHVTPKWGIDPKRIHATGFSAGAATTYVIAEKLTARFGSVAPVSGSGAGDKVLPAPLSLLTFQGGRDRLAQSFASTNSSWAKAAGCKDEKVTTLTMGGGPTHRYASSCNGGTEHIVYSVTQMGHEWPAEASALMWDFFVAHPLP